jgi:pimeloyl-ACP methyl ester carboxylesterase
MCFLTFLILSVPATGQAEGEIAASAVEWSDGVDPVISYLKSPALWQELQDPSKSHDSLLYRVHSFSYYVPFAPGKSLYVTESFSLYSVLRRPARAAIFLPGPAFRGSFWSIPLEGYNITEMAAARGFFAFTIDYVGVGNSYLPPDGSQATFLANVAPVKKLIDFVRHWRRVGRVDLIGEGFGGPIAATLAADFYRVRSVVLSTVTYRDMNPALLAFFSPELEAFLRSQPDGYWLPTSYAQTLVASPEPVRSWVLETQPGPYPTGQALQFWDLGMPYFDPAQAQVPALIIQGERDAFPAAGDSENLVNEWAAGAQLVVIPKAGHVPRIESEAIVAQYTEALFGFLDP